MRNDLRRGAKLRLESKLGTFLRSVGWSEGAQMYADGKADAITRLTGKRKGCAGEYQLVGYRLKEFQRPDESDPCSITHTEMMANVGLSYRDGKQVSSEYEHSTHLKVAEWGRMTREFRTQITVAA